MNRMPRQPFKDPRGNSGVTAYESSLDYIDVQFRNGSRYRYTYQVPGRSTWKP